jgi:type II secretory pathway component PulK
VIETRRHRTNGSEAGVALIAALSMLILFALLGAAYVTYMSGEFDRTRYEVQTLHARQLAHAGIQAAIGELHRALERGETPPAAYAFRLPVYDQQREPEFHEVTVAVSDEAARINLNFAPREVLEAIGLDRAQIRELKRAMPREDGSEAGARRWLLSVADLRQRGYVNAAGYTALDPAMLTVYSSDPRNPAGYINLNSASPAVLAAVLNVSPEDAEAIAQKRPFTSWDDAVQKIGRGPETFNIQPDEAGAMPQDFALSSRSYRLTSEAALTMGRGARRIRHTIEAVVHLDQEGGYAARYWNEFTGQREEPEPDAEPVAEITEMPEPETGEGSGLVPVESGTSESETGESEEAPLN